MRVMSKSLRKCLEALRYAAAIAVGGLYVWAIVFLVRNDNWAGISALTTMLLAIAAFWTIRQNYGFRKSEKKERLLIEIICWAVDVAQVEYSVSIEEPPLIFTKLFDENIREYDTKDKEKLAWGIMQDHKRIWQSRYMNLHRNYQTLDAKGEYILSLSVNKDFENIQSTIKSLKQQILDYENILWEYMKNMDDETKRGELEDKAKELNTNALKLIREATEIKTRDIG